MTPRNDDRSDRTCPICGMEFDNNEDMSIHYDDCVILEDEIMYGEAE